MKRFVQGQLFPGAAATTNDCDSKAHQAFDQAALRRSDLPRLWLDRLESLSPRAHQALKEELQAAGISVEAYFVELASLNAPAISTFLFELASKRDS